MFCCRVQTVPARSGSMLLDPVKVVTRLQDAVLTVPVGLDPLGVILVASAHMPRPDPARAGLPPTETEW